VAISSHVDVIHDNATVGGLDQKVTVITGGNSLASFVERG